jgi:ATP-dependent Lhr-like helicase
LSEPSTRRRVQKKAKLGGAYALPEPFAGWFKSRGWSPRPHQLELAEMGARGESALLIAPTGGGKTLAGFLPSLIDLHAEITAWNAQSPELTRNTGDKRPHRLHTLYLSPLKALAVDVARNLDQPVREMGLEMRIESRTGDTPPAKRTRQRAHPPDILLTTPEQLALFLAQGACREFFGDLKAVIVDEIHAMAPTKRGDLLALGLAALERYAPGYRRVGLSATVSDPDALARWLAPQRNDPPLPREGERASEPQYPLMRGLAGELGEGAASRLAAGGATGKREATRDPTPSPSPPTNPGLNPGLGRTYPLPLAGERDVRRAVPLIFGQGGARAEVEVLSSEAEIPWAGHSARHALQEVYERIKLAKTALVFVNTRSQAEMTFAGLWTINDDNLAIALHHGSLAVEQRRKVEAAMARGALRAVVCTSTLDLGIDWGDVDLVIQMGAPKGASRLVQRIGRSNHRLDEPSRALLAPSNRFEVLECRAAKDAVEAGELDGETLIPGALDALAQHVMGRACGDPFDPLDLYDEIRLAAPYTDLSWETFERVIDLVSTGGYTLRTYERFKRIVKGRDGLWRARDPDTAQRHRLNIGTIVEATYLEVRLVQGGGHAAKIRHEAEASRRKTGRAAAVEGVKRIKAPPSPSSAGGGSLPPRRPKRNLRPGVPITDKAPPMRAGRMLGKIEEWFIEHLAPGDSFLFAGEILRLEGVVETMALVSRAAGETPSTPSWNGGKFPLSTFLAKGVRAMISNPARWADLPDQVREWLEYQRLFSLIPEPDQLLVETFPRGAKHYLAAYPFEGRLAHQTLGMLLTRRLERARRKPLGFVANDYALLAWGLEPMDDMDLADLFAEDMLGDDLDAWLKESALMKRTFRDCAMIAGLIERRSPGHEKTGRQVTFSTDLIYDVLREHQPDHILLEAAWRDAGKGLLDIARLAQTLARVRGRLLHARLDHISPLAVPLMLEIGKVPIDGEARESILEEASRGREREEEIVAEAMGRAG